MSAKILESWRRIVQARDNAEMRGWDDDSREEFDMAVRWAEEETGMPFHVIERSAESAERALLWEAA